MRSSNFSLVLALLLLGVIMTLLRPATFLSQGNLLNIALAVVMMGLCALAQTLVILTGGIDISVGSTVGLTSVVCALVAAGGAGTGFGVGGIAAAIVVGLLCGMFNGALVAWGRVSPLIATLGTSTAYLGFTYIVTQGRSTPVLNPVLAGLNSTAFIGIPLPIWILIVFAMAFGVLMSYTDVGRNIYAVGGNPVAARLAGINVNLYLFGIYSLVGVMGGVAGVILTAKQGAGIPESGAGDLSLLSITAVALGGAALTGGIGTIGGTILGVGILGVLENGLLLLNVNALYQPVPRGLLLIVAVMIQQWRGSLRMPALRRPAGPPGPGVEVE
ncbi:MAG: ABC transporter permease [Propionibacteriaceae bacterium]|nr:ABC transporter permease [Propionibacteriaceae bacterium]